jgi:hypothetical protein
MWEHHFLLKFPPENVTVTVFSLTVLPTCTRTVSVPSLYPFSSVYLSILSLTLSLVSPLIIHSTSF